MQCSGIPPPALQPWTRQRLGMQLRSDEQPLLHASPALQDLPHHHHRPHTAHVWRQRPRHPATDVPGKELPAKAAWKPLAGQRCWWVEGQC